MAVLWITGELLKTACPTAGCAAAIESTPLVSGCFWKLVMYLGLRRA